MALQDAKTEGCCFRDEGGEEEEAGGVVHGFLGRNAGSGNVGKEGCVKEGWRHEMGNLYWIRSEEKVGNPLWRNDGEEFGKNRRSVGRREVGWATS